MGGICKEWPGGSVIDKDQYDIHLEPGRYGGYVIIVTKVIKYEQRIVVPSDVIDDDQELEAHIAQLKQRIEEQINGNKNETSGEERTYKG